MKLLLVLLLCSLAAHSQPVNDRCANAISITSVPWNSGVMNTVGATRDYKCNPNGNPFTFNNDVWFVYSPTTSHSINLNVCGSSFDTVLFYSDGGTCSDYRCVVYNDDCCGTSSCFSNIETHPGHNYFFTIAGKNGATGTYTLSVDYAGIDGCSRSLTVPSDPLSSLPFVAIQPLAATAATDLCDSKPAIWYDFTPLSDVTVVIDTCSTAGGFDTVLYVVTGSCGGAQTCIQTNDDTCGVASQLTASFLKGQQYFIVVSSYYASAGTPTLTITPLAPGNDYCAAARVIASVPYTDYTYFTAATVDFVCSTGAATTSSVGRDAWYSLNSPTAIQNVVVSTCYSGASFTVYIATGSCASKQCWRSDSNSCPFSDSFSTGTLTGVDFAAQTNYFIAVAANSPSGVGYVKLNMYIPPVNDKCAAAVQVTTLPFTYSGSNLGAWPDFVCPTAITAGATVATTQDVFFKFTPAATWTNVVVNLCGVNYDSFVYLVSGSCSSFSCLAYDDDGCGAAGSGSILSGRTLTAGTTYFFVVSGWSQTSAGSYTLTVTGTQYNSCPTAGVISSIPYSFTSDTTGNTGGFSCSSSSTVGTTRTMWFTFTPSVNYPHVSIDTCVSSFDTILHLTTGTCASLLCGYQNDDSTYCGTFATGSMIYDVSLTAGTTYFILVYGYHDWDFGVFTLAVNTLGISISSPLNGATIPANQLGSLVVSGTTGSLFNSYPVTVTLSDTSMSTADVLVGTTVNLQSAWSVSTYLSSLVDGTITITASLVDYRGVTIQTSITVVKDSTTFVSISSPSAGSYVTQTNQNNLVVSGRGEVGATVFVTIIDSASSTVVSSSVVVNGNGGWSVSVNIGSLASGTLRITATASDILGNTATSETVSVTKDTMVSVSILSPTTNQFVISQTRANSLNINGFADADATVFVTVVDSASGRLVSSSVTVSAVGTWNMILNVSSLGDGVLTFTATATDAHGNVANSLPVTLNKDTRIFPATVITSPTAGSTVSSSLTITGSGEVNARINLVITSGTGVINRYIPAIPASGIWSTVVSIPWASGSAISIGGTTSDLAGNSAPIPSVDVRKA